PPRLHECRFVAGRVQAHLQVVRGESEIAPVSAAIACGAELVWGSNGAIELYLEQLAAAAAVHGGPDDRLVRFFAFERAAFNMGAVVQLDTLLGDPAQRTHLLQVFDDATSRMRDCGELTEHGVQWLEAAAPQIRRLISG